MSSVQPRQIPILDLQPEIDKIWPQLSVALERTIRSGQFILGPETRSFESEAAAFLGVKHAIGVNSGTDALVIGLRAAGVGPGDEVITTPFSFFATAESISNVGAKPVFVDVDLDSMNIDADLIESAITDKTKAVLPVHLFGRCASMSKIMALAEKYNLKVVEDCAQSFGSTYEAGADSDSDSCEASVLFGKQSGTIGDVGAYSFFPTKNLGCYGDGGLLTTNDDMIAEMARRLRAHGSLKKYQNEILGYNSRLDSVQAAILRIKLPLIPSYTEGRRSVALRYWNAFSDFNGIHPPAMVPGHVFHQYTVRILNGKRDAVQAKLQEMGISTMIYYPIPQDRLPVYAGQYPTFIQNEILSGEVLSLPIWPQLDTETQDHVIECVKEAIQSV